MGDDDVIGTITGTATFEKVKVRDFGDGKAEVVGKYHGDETVYRTEVERIFIGGARLTEIDEQMMLEPTDDNGDYLWVDATSEELHITNESPES